MVTRGPAVTIGQVWGYTARRSLQSGAEQPLIIYNNEDVLGWDNVCLR